MTEIWASPLDFATLYHYFWYRDFPMDQKATGAHRVDWTIHIGVVVRKVADYMGLVTRFESGKRTDAMLRSRDGDEVAVEWEWNGVFGKNNELDKLLSHDVRPKGKEKLKYAVLITYTHTENIDKVYAYVKQKWDSNPQWPLLLILLDVKDVSKSTYTMGKEFNNIHMSLFDNGERKSLRLIPALPWEVIGTRWT
jgi:hypothetical protein